MNKVQNLIAEYQNKVAFLKEMQKNKAVSKQHKEETKQQLYCYNEFLTKLKKE